MGIATEDDAYIEALTAEGLSVPLVGGLGFVLWGAIIGTAALIAAFIDFGVIRFLSPLVLWTIAIALGWVASFVTGRQTHTKPGARSLGNRTVAAAWGACGIVITVFWLTIILANVIAGPEAFPAYRLFAAMFPLAFGLYGLAFFVMAVVAGQGWYRLVSIGAWLTMALLILSLPVLPQAHMLIAAAGSYAVMLVPGLIIRRGEPTDIV